MKKRILSLILCLCMMAGILCTGAAAADPEPAADNLPVYGEDYISLYDAIGERVAPSMVEVKGWQAFVTLDGQRYELGLDFLARAMIYNSNFTYCSKDEAFDEPDELFAFWWKLFILRWNHLVPELLLYSEPTYYFYRSDLEDFKVTPSQPAVVAVQKARLPDSADSSVTIGYISPDDRPTDYCLNAQLSDCYLSNGNTIVDARTVGDLALEHMITGLSTVFYNEEGRCGTNGTVVRSTGIDYNADGTVTFIVELQRDLKFSDGSPITAQNYLCSTLVLASPMGMALPSGGANAGHALKGYEEYHKGGVPFSGLHLIDDYHFNVTVDAEHAGYYAMGEMDFKPVPLEAWCLTKELIRDDGEGVYIAPEFFARDAAGDYKNLQPLRENNHNFYFPTSGPYYVQFYMPDYSKFILMPNKYYKGDYLGVKPSIKQVLFRFYDGPDEAFSALERGEIDCIDNLEVPGLALDFMGYLEGKPQFSDGFCEKRSWELRFRGDFGPVSQPEVRRALAYATDRVLFLDVASSNLGTLNEAPYYKDFWAYAQQKDSIQFEDYTHKSEGANDPDSPVDLKAAREELIKGGWIYDENGREYDEKGLGIRYKKLDPEELTFNNINYASADGRIKTTHVGNDYFMPLVINWCAVDFESMSPEERELNLDYINFQDAVESWVDSSEWRELGIEIQIDKVANYNQESAQHYQDESMGYQPPARDSLFCAHADMTGRCDYSRDWSIDPEHMGAPCVTDEADYWTIRRQVQVFSSEAEESGAGFYRPGETAVIHAGKREGYTFTGWTSKVGGAVLADASAPDTSFVVPDADVIAVANWSKDGTLAMSDAFDDVPANAWYNYIVNYAYVNNLMKGVGKLRFKPEQRLSRAELAQILYNNEGKPKITREGDFPDVVPDSWYASAVSWASEHKIVSGYPSGDFGPTDMITREQLVAILWRYAGRPEVYGKMPEFKDSKKISTYAKGAMQWAIQNNIVSGKGNGLLDPQGQATRAEVAKMIMYYVETVDKVKR